jgi:predicted GH43/DUF377 family glycosyl hydrolase
MWYRAQGLQPPRLCRQRRRRSLEPPPAVWDNKSVGNNGVPIKTAEGWLLINHGFNEDHVYKFGVVLLDNVVDE